MSPRRKARPMSYQGFPRVSGDEPITDARPALHAVFSPRERG